MTPTRRSILKAAAALPAALLSGCLFQRLLKASPPVKPPMPYRRFMEYPLRMSEMSPGVYTVVGVCHPACQTVI